VILLDHKLKSAAYLETQFRLDPAFRNEIEKSYRKTTSRPKRVTTHEPRNTKNESPKKVTIAILTLYTTRTIKEDG